MGMGMGSTSSGGCCCGGGTPTFPCSPCAIPEENLTLSYVNILEGNGSITLDYTASPLSWTSACLYGFQFDLLCSGGDIEFRAIYWLTGSCPGPGTTQYCSNLRASPLTLTLASYTCSPFSLTFTVTSGGCEAVASAGFTSFTITA
jgi:hypothetical protein